MLVDYDVVRRYCIFSYAYSMRKMILQNGVGLGEVETTARPLSRKHKRLMMRCKRRHREMLS